MAYVTINSATISPGEPVTSDLFNLIKSDLDDHEARLVTLASGSGKIDIINEDFLLAVGGNLTGALYYVAIQNCIVTEGAVRIFAKSPATTGSLTVDVRKNTSTDPSGFNTIFTSAPTINVAVAADHTRATGTISPSSQAVSIGDVLRVDVTSLPTGLPSFRLELFGEF